VRSDQKEEGTEAQVAVLVTEDKATEFSPGDGIRNVVFMSLDGAFPITRLAPEQESLFADGIYSTRQLSPWVI
jgi:hypothetical protein